MPHVPQAQTGQRDAELTGAEVAIEILEQAQSELSAAKCVEMHKMVSDAAKGNPPQWLDSLITPEEAMERWKDADK